MNVIWKFPLDFDASPILVPMDTRMVHVGMDESTGAVTLWGIVNLSDGSRNKEGEIFYIKRQFLVLPTGFETFPDGPRYEYLGTAQGRGFVWHVIEVKS